MLVRKEFLFVMLFSAFLAGCNGGRQGAILAVDGSTTISVMDYKEPMTIDPLPAGWLHRKFFRTAPMDISIGMRDGHAAIRLETRASASMLYRFTDIDIVAYPNLNWDWMVERPIVSANAGACFAPEALNLAASRGLRADKLLAANEAYGFFEASGGLITTGPTRTNVNDYRVILIV